jgi:hypothetical protein
MSQKESQENSVISFLRSELPEEEFVLLSRTQRFKGSPMMEKFN